jgi:tetratricopeptide (TPR) repeat protein
MAAGTLAVVVCLLPAARASTPTQEASSGKSRAYYLFSLAQQAQLRSQLPEAARFLEEAVRSADSSDLRLELAELYSTMNKSEEAEREARQAVKLDPGSPSARSTLAQILFQRAVAGADPPARLKESESIYQDLLDHDQADETSAQALADLQRGREDLAAAAATLERYRASHSGSVEVDFNLARIYLDLGKSEEARRLLEGNLEKDPDSRETRQLLADVLEEAGEAKEAVEIFQPVTESNPSNPYGQYRLGALMNSAGDFENAQKHLLQALQADPGNVRVLLALGQAYLGSGDNREAEDMYQRALDHDASSLEARFFLGRIAQARAEDDRAMALYSQILSQTAEKSSPRDRAFFGLASFQTALIDYFRKDYPGAAAKVSDALEAASHPSTELYGLLVRIRIESGDFSQARAELERALKALPDSPEMLSLKAEILLREGDKASARAVFAEILKGQKDSEAAYLLVLQACSRSESNREGAAWAQRGIEAHADSEALAFQHAAFLERSGDFKKSEAAFRSLVQRYPDNAEALNYLGYMLADRGMKLDDALGLIQRAIVLDPDNPAFLDSLGWALYKLGRPEEAESYLVRAAEGSRDDPTVLEHLGDLKLKLKKPAEALKAYQTALARGPENPAALKKKIRKLAEYSGSP